MKFCLIFAFCSFGALSSGCTYQYVTDATHRGFRLVEFSDKHNVVAQRGVTLAAGSQLYLAVAKDGFPLEVKQAILNQLGTDLLSYFPIVTTSVQSKSIDDAINDADVTMADFLLYTHIVKQDDHLSSFSEMEGKPTESESVGFDKMLVQISVWDVNNRSWVESTSVDSRTPFFQVNEHTPEELIEGAIASYVRSIVGVF